MNQAFRIFLLALVTSAVVNPASAQQTVNLQELEQQLEALKKQEAADKKAAEVAEAKRRTAEAARIGRVFRDKLKSGGEGPVMVTLPAGHFEQGSPSYESDRATDESPLHGVSIRAFSLGKHEVTRGEYRKFIEATGYKTDAERNVTQGCFSHKGGTDFGWNKDASWRDAGFPQDDSHPVVCVNHNDAQAYAEWLRIETGKPYRLPTESELEYANRADTTSSWPWGADGNAGCDAANYGDASAHSRFSTWATAACDDGHVFTAPVGSFRANSYGLHDTAGNVWEWTQDCWNGNYNEAPNDGRTWASGDCTRRVLRGGSWFNRPQRLRSAARYSHPATTRYLDVGFRMARD